MRLKTKYYKRSKAKIITSKSSRNEDELIILSAKSASSKAIRSSMALGLSFKIIKGNTLISVLADKTEKVERELRRSSIDLSKYKKGMYLERK